MGWFSKEVKVDPIEVLQKDLESEMTALNSLFDKAVELGLEVSINNKDGRLSISVTKSIFKVETESTKKKGKQNAKQPQKGQPQES